MTTKTKIELGKFKALRAGDQYCDGVELKIDGVVVGRVERDLRSRFSFERPAVAGYTIYPLRGDASSWPEDLCDGGPIDAESLSDVRRIARLYKRAS